MNHSSKKCGNRYTYLFPTHGQQVTNATETGTPHGRSLGTQSTLKSKSQFFKLTNKDYHSEIEKYSEVSWFRSIAKQFKVAEQQNDAHSVRKLKRVVEHPLVIKGLICSVRTSRTRS